MNDSPLNTGFRVDQIDHIELFVPDRHQAAEWYRSVLGLERLSQYEHWVDDPQGPLMISSDAGKTKLALFRGTPQGSRETADQAAELAHQCGCQMCVPSFVRSDLCERRGPGVIRLGRVERRAGGRRNDVTHV